MADDAKRFFGAGSKPTQTQTGEAHAHRIQDVMAFLLPAVALLSAPQAPTPIATPPPTQAEAEVRKSVQAFYEAYNAHAFEKLSEFTSEDWTHTPEDIAVRFATADVAVVTVRSRTTPFTSPDGVRHENESRVRTFVVVKRDGRWLIMQDQNTTASQR